MTRARSAAYVEGKLEEKTEPEYRVGVEQRNKRDIKSRKGREREREMEGKIGFGGKGRKKMKRRGSYRNVEETLKRKRVESGENGGEDKNEVFRMSEKIPRSPIREGKKKKIK